jgi:hypothetical protein
LVFRIFRLLVFYGIVQASSPDLRFSERSDFDNLLSRTRRDTATPHHLHPTGDGCRNQFFCKVLEEVALALPNVVFGLDREREVSEILVGLRNMFALLANEDRGEFAAKEHVYEGNEAVLGC